MDDAADRAPSLLDAPPVIENPTDAELVEAARAGDAFAITRLWQRHLAVAWTAARAASGRPDAEPVVVRTAERLIAGFGEGAAPSGAVRPHLLALTRHALADDEGVPGAEAHPAGHDDRPGLELAPVETYRDVLPEGMGDGTAVAAAYAALPTRWQESLWLAEIEGLTDAEVAAELGLSADAASTMLADARAALRAEWSSVRAAGLPDGAACAAAADSRRGGDHLDACAECRVVAAPPEAVSRRAMATLPLLLLGAGGGIAFLEAQRRGASAAATEPVPFLAQANAAVPGARAASTPALPAAAGATGVAGAIRTAPRRRLAAVGAALGGLAAAAAVVMALVAGSGGGDPSMFLADLGAGGDSAEPAPEMMPPVIVATDLPEEPESTRPPATAPDASPDAPDDANGDGTSDGATSGDGTTDGGTDGGTGAPSDGAEQPTAPAPPDGGQQASAPGSPAEDRVPIQAELGGPGANGWRTLSVSGEAGADFTVSSGDELLFAGTLDAAGDADLQVRGTSGDVGSLTVEYGTGDAGYSTAAEGAPSEETARRGRTSAPTPGS